MNNFNGWDQDRSYFEGWYLKHQVKDRTVAFIPAFHIDSDGRRSSSIQVVTGEGAWNFTFPQGRFLAAGDRFSVQVGDNLFCRRGMAVHLEQDGFSIRGKLYYGAFTPLKYDIMGPFSLFHHMECNHGVLSLGHELHGSLTINGEKLTFCGGRGYVEKDWGSSFPKSYLWTQSNDFTEECCVMISAANIPFLGGAFPGCIACVWLRGKEYRLATYLGGGIARCSQRKIVVKQGKLRLEAELLEEKAFGLAAPQSGGMSRMIRESPACRVRYRFTEGCEVLLDEVSPGAGFEVGGNLDCLTGHRQGLTSEKIMVR